MTLIAAELTFAGMGALFAVLAVPLIMERIKPNHWYGFRTRQSLSDERVWYPLNAFGGKILLFMGVKLILLSVGLTFMPGMSGDLLLWVMVFVLLFDVISLLIATFLHQRYLVENLEG